MPPLGGGHPRISELVRAAGSTAWAVLLAVAPGRDLANWGTTDEERRHRFAGDVVMPDADIRWLRSITVRAPAAAVWPWVAQIGRGAGYYSYDILDNGGRPSAGHLIPIPAPARGDRNEAIGEVVAVEDGREIVWRTDVVRFLGASVTMVLAYAVVPATGRTCRVVTVVLARVRGRTAWPVRQIFAVMDFVMASEQLRGLKRRVENPSASPHAGPCRGAADHQRDRAVLVG